MPSWKEDLAKSQEDFAKNNPEVNVLPVDIDTENGNMKRILGEDAFDNLLDDDVPAPARPTVPPPPNSKVRPAMKTRTVIETPKVEKVKMTEEKDIKVTEEEEEEEKEEEEYFDPYKYLETLPGSPSKELVERWKVAYGDVQFVPLENNSAFIYRCLNYPEWKGKILMNKALVENETLLEEYVINNCVLWPILTPEKQAGLKAGLPKLMFNMIMESSYFIPTERAMAITVRL